MAPGQNAPATSELTPAEAAAAIRTLTDVGWVRLRKIARAFALSRPADADDLLQRAMMRTLEGKRRCPRDVDIIKFLADVMRSIASDWAKARRRRPDHRAVPLEGGPDDPPIDPPEDRPDQEEQLIEAEEAARLRQRVIDLFADDVEAQVMVEGIMEGMEGEALRATTGLDKTAFASKRRQIRRQLDKTYPAGWKP